MPSCHKHVIALAIFPTMLYLRLYLCLLLKNMHQKHCKKSLLLVFPKRVQNSGGLDSGFPIASEWEKVFSLDKDSINNWCSRPYPFSSHPTPEIHRLNIWGQGQWLAKTGSTFRGPLGASTKLPPVHVATSTKAREMNMDTHSVAQALLWQIDNLSWT